MRESAIKILLILIIPGNLQIDSSADGKLDLMELLDYIGLKSSSFARRVRLYSQYYADSFGI